MGGGRHLFKTLARMRSVRSVVEDWREKDPSAYQGEHLPQTTMHILRLRLAAHTQQEKDRHSTSV